jgi:GT2 family glycosyltransferase
MDIIVVDNNSSDNTADVLKTLDVNSILSEQNLGFGRAVNLGFNNSIGPYILILNPDTILHDPESLVKIYEFIRDNQQCGIAAPALVYTDGETQISARTIPRRRDFLFGRGSPLFKLRITRESDAGYIIPKDNNPVEVPAVSATAIMLRSSIFKEIGGFDERFFMYLEDIDLCKRISEKNLKVYLLPEVKITHHWRKSSSQFPVKTMVYHHVSVFKYFVKHEKQQVIKNAFLLLALIGGFVISLILKLTGAKVR